MYPPSDLTPVHQYRSIERQHRSGLRASLLSGPHLRLQRQQQQQQLLQQLGQQQQQRPNGGGGGGNCNLAHTGLKQSSSDNYLNAAMDTCSGGQLAAAAGAPHHATGPVSALDFSAAPASAHSRASFASAQNNFIALGTLPRQPIGLGHAHLAADARSRASALPALEHVIISGKKYVHQTTQQQQQHAPLGPIMNVAAAAAAADSSDGTRSDPPTEGHVNGALGSSRKQSHVQTAQVNEFRVIGAAPAPAKQQRNAATRTRECVAAAAAPLPQTTTGVIVSGE